MTAERYPLKRDVDRTADAVDAAVDWRAFEGRDRYRAAVRGARDYARRPVDEQVGTIPEFSACTVDPAVPHLTEAMSFFAGMVVAQRTTAEECARWRRGIRDALVRHGEAGREPHAALAVDCLLAGVRPIGTAASPLTDAGCVAGEMARQRRVSLGLEPEALAKQLAVPVRAVRAAEAGEAARVTPVELLGAMGLPGARLDLRRAAALCGKLAALAVKVEPDPQWYARVALRFGEDVSRAVVVLAASSLLAELADR